MKFGPKNSREELVFAIESLRVEVQHAVHKAMHEGTVTQRELAKRMGITEQRVSQFFAADWNPTMVTLARLFHAVGHECAFSSRVDGAVTPAHQRATAWRVAQNADARAPKAKRTSVRPELIRRRIQSPPRYASPAGAFPPDLKAA